MPIIIGVTSGGVLVPVRVDDDGIVSVSSAVSSLPSLPAGDNNIGNVDVVTLPTLPAGNNNIGNVDIVTLPALPTGTNEIGKIQARNYGLVGGAFQKDPIRIGYSSTVAEALSDTNLGAGPNNLDSTPVPEGEIHIMTNLAFQYAGTITGVSLMPSVILNSGVYPADYKTPVVSGAWYIVQGWWVLRKDDWVRLNIVGATATDDANLRITGFRVDIDQ